jgi:deoxycytidylate deaminase
MTKKNYHFLKIVEKISQKSDMRHKLAAMIVHRNTVLSVGYNRQMGEYLDKKPIGVLCSGGAYSIHAELDALNKCFKVYPEHRIMNNKLVLYVARKGFKLAKPCDDCQTTLKRYGISEIYFTNGEENAL